MREIGRGLSSEGLAIDGLSGAKNLTERAKESRDKIQRYRQTERKRRDQTCAPQPNRQESHAFCLAHLYLARCQSCPPHYQTFGPSPLPNSFSRIYRENSAFLETPSLKKLQCPWNRALLIFGPAFVEERVLLEWERMCTNNLHTRV